MPHEVPVTEPVKTSEYSALSTALRRTSGVARDRVDEDGVCPSADPPATSITLVSKTRRTEPSGMGRERGTHQLLLGQAGDGEPGPAGGGGRGHDVDVGRRRPAGARRRRPRRASPRAGSSAAAGTDAGAAARQRRRDVADLAVGDPDGHHAAGGGREAVVLLAEEDGAGLAAGEPLVVDQLEPVDLGGAQPEGRGVVAQPGAGGRRPGRRRRRRASRRRAGSTPACRGRSTGRWPCRAPRPPAAGPRAGQRCRAGRGRRGRRRGRPGW